MTQQSELPKAILFDVFGTVVDWRGSIVEEGEQVWRQRGLDVDWPAFADAWRGLYQPSMERIRSGEIGFVPLDVLHRSNLDQVLEQFGVADFPDAERVELNRIWHRLKPWPDVVEGLTRLKSKFIIGTLSNGNIALMVNMAKNRGLPWDVILGAEVSRQYKPHPQAYLGSARALDLPPSQCMLTAAHNSDLEAARDTGYQGAFVCRPNEYGPDGQPDLEPSDSFEFKAKSFTDLADQLGCD